MWTLWMARVFCVFICVCVRKAFIGVFTGYNSVVALWTQECALSELADKAYHQSHVIYLLFGDREVGIVFVVGTAYYMPITFKDTLYNYALCRVKHMYAAPLYESRLMYEATCELVT